MADDDRLVTIRDKLLEADWDNLLASDEEVTELQEILTPQDEGNWQEGLSQVAMDWLTNFRDELEASSSEGCFYEILVHRTPAPEAADG